MFLCSRVDCYEDPLLGTGFGQAHAAVYAARDVEVVMVGRNPGKTARIAGQIRQFLGE